VLDRSRALQIFGLSKDADEDEIRVAHAALCAHIESRLEAGAVAEPFREARRAELRELEQGFPDGAMAPAGVARWILGWAVIATLCAAGLALYVATLPGSFGPRVLVAGEGGEGGEGGGGFAIGGEGGDEGGEPGAPVDAESAGARTKLVAHSTIEEAVLEVRTRGEAPEVVAEGAADETVYWLSPGTYSLRVSHADCRDDWQQDLDLAGDEELDLEPELCGDTGWMVVRSNVADDQLSIDGEPVGPTGEMKRPVPPGEHEVRVEKKGYRAWAGIVEVEAGEVLGIRPRLERAEEAAKPRPRRTSPVAAPPDEQQLEKDRQNFEGWHEEARQWLLARFDLDRSGSIDSVEELELVPCEQWLGLEQSYDQSNLGLSLTRFYGFDGNGWRPGALGVADEARDLAYERMRDCGLK
jgi:hypothetical protein